MAASRHAHVTWSLAAMNATLDMGSLQHPLQGRAYGAARCAESTACLYSCGWGRRDK